MKIIIAGAGEVGYHLAKQLSLEAHDITVIDIDSSHLERVDANTDVMTLPGSSTQINILKQAGTENADLVVAVTSHEAVNINTALLAKKLGAKKTIARVSNAEYTFPENLKIFDSLGIDHLIYPEELAALEVVKLIERSAATDIIEFENGKLFIIGLRLESNSPILMKSLKEISLQYSQIQFRIIAIQRGIKTIIPTGDDIYKADDQIFVITNSDGIEKVIEATGKKSGEMQNIMILGGGKIGRRTAKLLEKRMNIKLIESNKDKTTNLADYLEDTLVIQGDGRDIDLLAQEGIIDMDGFVALTNDAETNIITCLMAKHLKVTKTIAQVDNVDYIPLTNTIGLDSMINKKLIAASSIIKFIRHEKIISVANLHGIDAEVLEYEAGTNSQITKAPVYKLKFPQNSILGGYIRDGKGYITVGSTQIQEGDKVIVVTMPGEIQNIEKLFR